MNYLGLRILIIILTSSSLLMSYELLGQEPKAIANDIIYIQDLNSGTDITDYLVAAIEQSSSGDIIVLPEGQFYLSQSVIIWDKVISIIGRGSENKLGTTLLRDPQNEDMSMFYISTNKPENSYMACIAGIHFKSLPSSRYSGGEEVSITDRCIFYDHIKRFLLTDNTFQYFGESGVTINHGDSIDGYCGLIFKNRFLDIYRPEIANLGYGIQVSGKIDWWIIDPEYGSKKFLFVEDNFFRENRHSIAGGSNGKYVFRKNIVEDNWAGAAVDMHGAGEFGNYFSTRASEVYGNSFSSEVDKFGNPLMEASLWSDYPPSAALIRGGESLIYDNSVTNYRSVAELSLEETTPESYPSQYQIGYISGLNYGIDHVGYTEGKGDGDAFFWDNYFEQKYPQWQKYRITKESTDTVYIKLDRDLHIDVEVIDYFPYIYPHDYRKLYYDVIDTLLSEISITDFKKISNQSIQLTWDNVIGEDGYYIYLSTDGATYNIIDSTEINVTSTLIDSLDADNYWFVVCAYNDDYQGNKSIPLKLNSDLNKAAHFRVFPNPSNGTINIQAIDLLLGSDSDVIDVFVWTIAGTLIFRESFQAASNEVYEMSIPNGLKGSLLISVQSGNIRQNEILSIY